MKGYLRYAGRMIVKNVAIGIAAVLAVLAVAFYGFVYLPEKNRPEPIVFRCGESVLPQGAGSAFCGALARAD